MITLDDLLRDLTYGEFAQLNLGNFLPEEHENEPDPKSYAQLSSWFNLGLKLIYSEFLLASEEIYVRQYPDDIDTYVLSYDYAVSNTASTQPIKYIIDTAEDPFNDNLLLIESVFEESGDQLFLNDSSEDFSLFTPTYRSLQIPVPNTFDTIAVQYRAGHPKIDYTPTMAPADIEVAIPHSLHEALLWYVASRAYAAFNTDQGQEGNPGTNQLQEPAFTEAVSLNILA